MRCVCMLCREVVNVAPVLFKDNASKKVAYKNEVRTG
jgi:hypothetical protein